MTWLEGGGGYFPIMHKPRNRLDHLYNLLNNSAFLAGARFWEWFHSPSGMTVAVMAGKGFE